MSALQQTVADLFGVSYAYVKKLLRQRRETGSVATKPHGGGHPAKLTPAQAARVQGYIEQTANDAAVDEVQAFIRRRLKVEVSRATAGRVLQLLALPRKKTLVATEQDEAQRAAFWAQMVALPSVRVVVTWSRTVFVTANRDVHFHAYRRPLLTQSRTTLRVESI